MNPAVRSADADSRSLLQQARNLSTILAMLALLLKDDPAQRPEDARAKARPAAPGPTSDELAQAAQDLRTRVASDAPPETIVPLILDDLSLAESAARRAERVTMRWLARIVSLVLSYVPFVAHDPLRTIIRKVPAKRRKLQAMLRGYGLNATRPAHASRPPASSDKHTGTHALHGHSR